MSMNNEAKLTPKMEATLTTALLALTTAPATKYSEAGELPEYALYNLGCGLPQLAGLVKRGILVIRRDKMVPSTGPYAGEEVSERYYSVA